MTRAAWRRLLGALPMGRGGKHAIAAGVRVENSRLNELIFFCVAMYFRTCLQRPRTV